jgi:hypothetical protein
MQCIGCWGDSSPNVCSICTLNVNCRVSRAVESTWVYDMNTIPWLTFLRFFALFVGVSDSGAEARFSFDGELLFAVYVVAVTLPCSVSFATVISREEAPFGSRAVSVIKRSNNSEPVAFRGEPQIDTFHDTRCCTDRGNALADVGSLSFVV